jgi:hypothetical protein
MATITDIRHVSDLTGQELNGDSVQVTIKFSDTSRGRVVLDAAETEVQELISKGKWMKALGRPKVTA